jgi:chromobox protein 1
LYKVEKIVDHDILSGHLFYLVKWVGWNDPEDMTWEPEETIRDCRYYVAQYQRTLVPFSTVTPPAEGTSVS